MPTPEGAARSVLQVPLVAPFVAPDFERSVACIPGTSGVFVTVCAIGCNC